MAAEVDEKEDRRYGRDKRGDELPEELAFREGRLRTTREAKEALEAEARAEAEPAEAEGKKHPSWALRNSSGISEGIYKSMVQSDREFLRVRVGDRQ